MRQVFSSIPGQVLDFIVVLIGLVIIFKKQLTNLVNSIFETINSKAGSI
jgi:uncharacterized iron-regulated membrane protein